MYRVAEGIDWLLVPMVTDSELLRCPQAVVFTDGRIGVQDGPTKYTSADLDFTGRTVGTDGSSTNS